MTVPPAPRLVAAVAVGGAVGAVLRWALSEAAPWQAGGTAFPWMVFAINVAGSFLLALLPALPPVRRSRTVAVALGPGVLGGFTTLSTSAEQTREMLAAHCTGLAAAYVLGTLAAALVAVAAASRLSSLAEQVLFEAEGGDE